MPVDLPLADLAPAPGAAPDTDLAEPGPAPGPDFDLDVAPRAGGAPAPISPVDRPVTSPPPPGGAAWAEALPVARPVRPPAATSPPDHPARPRGLPRGEAAPVRGARTAPTTRDDRPEDDAAPARPRVFAACAVMGCLGLSVLLALLVLTVCAIQVLDHMGNQIAEPMGAATPFGAGPGPVAATQLAQPSRQISLGAYDAVGRGASGRYLLLRQPRQKSLAVFDPNKGDVVHQFPLGEPRALFAAGASKLFLYKPSSGTVERWDLESRQNEQQTALAPSPGSVDAIAIGPGSDGPLYIISVPEIRVFDTVTLTQTATFTVPGWRAATWTHVRASDDGAVLGVTGKDGALVVRYGGRGPQAQSVALGAGDERPDLATPAPDGRTIYTPRGAFSPDGTAVIRPEGDYFYTFPADHGGLFLSREIIRGRVGGPVRLHTDQSARETGRVLGELGGDRGPDLVLPDALDADANHDITADQRTHLWPAAGVLATLPKSNAAIEVQKVDIEAALKAVHRATGKGYAVIWTDPPHEAVRNAEWRYRPEAWVGEERTRGGAKAGPGHWVLKTRPEGMSIDGKDLVWVPESTKTELVQIEFVDPNNAVLAAQGFRLRVVAPPQ